MHAMRGRQQRPWRGWSNDMVIAPLVRPYHILIFVFALLPNHATPTNTRATKWHCKHGWVLMG